MVVWRETHTHTHAQSVLLYTFASCVIMYRERERERREGGERERERRESESESERDVCKLSLLCIKMSAGGYRHLENKKNYENSAFAICSHEPTELKHMTMS